MSSLLDGASADYQPLRHYGADYNHGYAHGREKAHHDLRQCLLGAHVSTCTCELCITVSIVLANHNLDPRAER